MKESSSRYRPLITSLGFNNQNSYLPLIYNYSIEQIESIKKYLPKNLFKLNGIDVQDQSFTLTKNQQQRINKAKLKIKAGKGIFLDNKKEVMQVPREQVKMIEWYNKSISLKIPLNSKDSQIKIEALIFEHINYYLQNYVFFKNILTQQLYSSYQSTDSLSQQKEIKLTGQQLATQTDIIFSCWNIDKEPNDNTFKRISITFAIVLCLRATQSYSLKDIKMLIKSDVSNSISIMLKHNFNTRVVLIGDAQKQFVCLSSYCNEQNAFPQQDKLRIIIKQTRKNAQLIQTQQNRMISKKQNKFLILMLALLVLIYVFLKVNPIHGKDQAQYIKSKIQAQNTIQQDQQIF